MLRSSPNKPFKINGLVSQAKGRAGQLRGLKSIISPMNNCSFCGKWESRARRVVSSKQMKSARICEECLKICRDILDSKHEAIPKGARYRASVRAGGARGPLGCSFCGQPQKIVKKLISSPPGRRPCFICDRCVGESSTLVLSLQGKSFLDRLLALFRRKSPPIANSSIADQTT
jgi:hypothetical protein